jgi:uncharacterized surface protein with fasciclin (FAS1) repeats
MTRLFRIIPIFIIVIIIFNNCNSEKEEYYERPKNLAPPIYQKLEKEGRFSYFLKCIDKSGFKNVLNSTGYVTVFAPNDDAFKDYFNKNNITIDDIDSVKAREIVAYSIVYNAYRIDDFDRYQNGSFSPLSDSIAFKRKTYYYRGFFYENITAEGENFKAAIFDAPINSSSFSNNNNNKYIPVFNQAYFTKKNLKPSDYNHFYADVTFTGKNVAGAEIISADNEAENGIYHEINKVIEPLPNLEQAIVSNPNYSKFKELLDTLVTYVYSSDLANKYNNLPVKSDPTAKAAYIKYYPLLFSPNNENYFGSGNESQCDGYTIVAPTNEAFDIIMQNRIALYYPNKDYHNLPIDILTTFVNSHFFKTTMFPSSFSNGLNAYNEAPSFNFNSDIIESKICSNGIFYGSNTAMQSNIFMTVYGDIYLNKALSIFYYGVTKSNMIENLKIANKKYTLFLLKDNFFTSHGYEYNSERTGDPLYYKGKGTSKSPAYNPEDSLKAIISLHVANYIDFSKKGCIETYFGDVIGYDEDFKVYGAGNLEKGYKVDFYIIPGAAPINGEVYYVDSAILASTKGVGYHLEKYFSDFIFWKYISNSILYTAESQTISELKSSVNYTILMPSNNAIKEAVIKGDLPSDAINGDPNKIANFIKLHIIKNKSICNDKNKYWLENFLTTLPTSEGSAKVEVENIGDMLYFKSQKEGSEQIPWIENRSNILSNKAIIHAIDGYLKF